MQNEIQIVEVGGERIEVQSGGANVFEDLGLFDAPEMALKSKLAIQVIQFVRQAGLTQTEVAKRVGLKQPDISNIINGRLNGVSVERLFTVLNRLGHDVEVRVSSEERDNARTHCVVA